MISVILPTRNPHRFRFQRTLAGLRNQTLTRTKWECIVVDNNSTPALASASEPLIEELRARIVVAAEPGLTIARLAGIGAARGEVLVFVDDDNVLSPGYLAAVADRFAAGSSLAAAGGPVRPEWEEAPQPWTRPFHGLLALRDMGSAPLVAHGSPTAAWPDFAPVGAGLAVRRAHAEVYASKVAGDPRRRALDRQGKRLSSGGDNDLVFVALHHGGDIAYFPELSLTHLIPASRLAPQYLAQLNEGIMRSWVNVLHLHNQCPWPPIRPWTLPLRMGRAWVRYRAWKSPANYIRWRGAVGQFRGQADLST